LLISRRKSEMSVVLDDRKHLVFRPFEQISARFGGNVSVLRPIQSYPPPADELQIPPSSVRSNGLSRSPSSDPLVSGIFAADGHQSAFHVGYDRMLVRCGFSSLVELHLDHKTRLQLILC
jgi:hypothetical protein